MKKLENIHKYNIEELSCTAQYHMQQQIDPDLTEVPAELDKDTAMKYARVGNMLTYFGTLNEAEKLKLRNLNPDLNLEHLHSLMDNLEATPLMDIHTLELYILAAGTNDFHNYPARRKLEYVKDIQLAREVLAYAEFHPLEYNDEFDKFIHINQLDDTASDKSSQSREEKLQTIDKEIELLHQEDDIVYDEVQGTFFYPSALNNLDNTSKKDEPKNEAEDDEFEENPDISDNIKFALRETKHYQKMYDAYMEPISDYERAHPDQPCSDESLCGKCLVNIKAREGDMVEKSVIYITACNEREITGVMINKTLFQAEGRVMGTGEKIPLPEKYTSIRFGGPNAGCFCHIFYPIGEYTQEDPRELHQHGIAITSSPNALQDYFDNEFAQHCIVAMGNYTWTPKQLEWELSNNKWEIVPLSKDLIFTTPYFELWDKAYKNAILQDGKAPKASFV